MENRKEEEQNRRDQEQKYVKSTRMPDKKPENCPKCGGKNVTSCPGGASLKAVPGIWWICDSCKHQW